MRTLTLNQSTPRERIDRQLAAATLRDGIKFGETLEARIGRRLIIWAREEGEIFYNLLKIPTTYPDGTVGNRHTLQFIFKNRHIDGKQLVIETRINSKIDQDFLERLRSIAETFHLHIVLVSNFDQRLMERRLGLSVADYVSEYCAVHPNAKGYARSNWLIGSLRDRSDLGPDMMPKLLERVAAEETRRKLLGADGMRQ